MNCSWGNSWGGSWGNSWGGSWGQDQQIVSSGGAPRNASLARLRDDDELMLLAFAAAVATTWI